ncbi:hemin uptake protein HemP [Limnohabitans sp. INBF002]|uniref:hemin uptake protein HemP n=1 Tax=Limnohabitans sp. INBF002 TaxID=2986280 RepID=UPI0024926332|nr:hemin uptake protein HemP [Limnohabitans sp. INBF002]
MSTRPPTSASIATSATQPAPSPAPTTATGCVGPLRVDSAALMGGQRVLEIVHLGEVYRLQTTRFGKLILTK